MISREEVLKQIELEHEERKQNYLAYKIRQEIQKELLDVVFRLYESIQFNQGKYIETREDIYHQNIMELIDKLSSHFDYIKNYDYSDYSEIGKSKNHELKEFINSFYIQSKVNK